MDNWTLIISIASLIVASGSLWHSSETLRYTKKTEAKNKLQDLSIKIYDDLNEFALRKKRIDKGRTN